MNTRKILSSIVSVLLFLIFLITLNVLVISALNSSNMAKTQNPITPTGLMETTDLQNFQVLDETENTSSILFSDQIFLEVDTGRRLDKSKYLFDFDKNAFDAKNLQENDLKFSLTNSPTPFLVLAPINGAKGIDLTGNEDEGGFSECVGLQEEYSEGGKPISGEGLQYCWRTNLGNIVRFSVNEITVSDGVYKIKINFVVWNN